MCCDLSVKNKQASEQSEEDTIVENCTGWRAWSATDGTGGQTVLSQDSVDAFYSVELRKRPVGSRCTR